MDKHTTGDGIVSALLVLQAACRTDRSMSQMLERVSLYPQVLINVRVQPGTDWSVNPKMVEVREAVTRELGNTGRVLIRPSGTEPLVRVMVEAQVADQAQDCADRLAATLR